MATTAATSRYPGHFTVDRLFIQDDEVNHAFDRAVASGFFIALRSLTRSTSGTVASGLSLLFASLGQRATADAGRWDERKSQENGDGKVNTAGFQSWSHLGTLRVSALASTCVLSPVTSDTSTLRPAAQAGVGD
jgi:hypothetical protein